MPVVDASTPAKNARPGAAATGCRRRRHAVDFNSVLDLPTFKVRPASIAKVSPAATAAPPRTTRGRQTPTTAPLKATVELATPRQTAARSASPPKWAVTPQSGATRPPPSKQQLPPPSLSLQAARPTESPKATTAFTLTTPLSPLAIGTSSSFLISRSRDELLGSCYSPSPTRSQGDISPFHWSPPSRQQQPQQQHLRLVASPAAVTSPVTRKNLVATPHSSNHIRRELQTQEQSRPYASASTVPQSPQNIIAAWVGSRCGEILLAKNTAQRAAARLPTYAASAATASNVGCSCFVPAAGGSVWRSTAKEHICHPHSPRPDSPSRPTPQTVLIPPPQQHQSQSPALDYLSERHGVEFQRGILDAAIWPPSAPAAGAPTPASAKTAAFREDDSYGSPALRQSRYTPPLQQIVPHGHNALPLWEESVERQQPQPQHAQLHKQVAIAYTQLNRAATPNLPDSYSRPEVSSPLAATAGLSPLQLPPWPCIAAGDLSTFSTIKTFQQTGISEPQPHHYFTGGMGATRGHATESPAADDIRHDDRIPENQILHVDSPSVSRTLSSPISRSIDESLMTFLQQQSNPTPATKTAALRSASYDKATSALKSDSKESTASRKRRASFSADLGRSVSHRRRSRRETNCRPSSKEQSAKPRRTTSRGRQRKAAVTAVAAEQPLLDFAVEMWTPLKHEARRSQVKNRPKVRRDEVTIPPAGHASANSKQQASHRRRSSPKAERKYSSAKEANVSRNGATLKQAAEAKARRNLGAFHDIWVGSSHSIDESVDAQTDALLDSLRPIRIGTLLAGDEVPDKSPVRHCPITLVAESQSSSGGNNSVGAPAASSNGIEEGPAEDDNYSSRDVVGDGNVSFEAEVSPGSSLCSALHDSDTPDSKLPGFQEEEGMVMNGTLNGTIGNDAALMQRASVGAKNDSEVGDNCEQPAEECKCCTEATVKSLRTPDVSQSLPSSEIMLDLTVVTELQNTESKLVPLDSGQEDEAEPHGAAAQNETRPLSFPQPWVLGPIARAHVVQIDVDDTLLPTSQLCEEELLEKPLHEYPEAYRAKLTVLDHQLTRLFELLHQMVIQDEATETDLHRQQQEKHTSHPAAQSMPNDNPERHEHPVLESEKCLDPEVATTASDEEEEEAIASSSAGENAADCRQPTSISTRQEQELPSDHAATAGVNNAQSIPKSIATATEPSCSGSLTARRAADQSALDTQAVLDIMAAQQLPSHRELPGKVNTPRGVVKRKSSQLANGSIASSSTSSSASSTASGTMAASKAGYLMSVVIVTNAAMSHIRTVFPKFFPCLSRFFQSRRIGLDDLVCSARDLWCDEFPFEHFYDYWKCWTLEDVLGQLKQDGVPSLTVLSIGDDEPERNAVAYARREMPDLVTGTKVIKLLTRPDIDDISIQVECLIRRLRRYISQGAGFDIQYVLQSTTNISEDSLSSSRKERLLELLPSVNATSPILHQLAPMVLPYNGEAGDADALEKELAELLDECVQELPQVIPPEAPNPFEAALIQFELKFDQLHRIFKHYRGKTDLAKVLRPPVEGLDSSKKKDLRLLALDAANFLQGVGLTSVVELLQFESEHGAAVAAGNSAAPGNGNSNNGEIQYIDTSNIWSIYTLVHAVLRFLLLYPSMHLEFTRKEHQSLTVLVAHGIVSAISRADPEVEIRSKDIQEILAATTTGSSS